MKSFGATLALAGAASAAAIQSRAAPVAECCFGINVNGAVSGSVGQLSDGQNRVGSGFGGAQFCYYPSTTSIVDESGRGCIATGPTSQYQCDAGLTASTATSGITLASNGSIEHNGSAVWYECNSGSGYNLYTMNPGSAATGCSEVTLEVSGGNCTAPASSSSAPASSAPATSPAASTSVKTSTVVSASTVESATTETVATPTTKTVATPTTVVSATTQEITTTQEMTETVASPTTLVSVSKSVSVESCVPTTATVTETAPAPPAVTVTAPAPPAVTVTVQGPCSSAPAATPPAVSSPIATPPAVSSPGASSPAPSSPAGSASVPPVSLPSPISTPSAGASTSTQTVQSTLTLTQPGASSTQSAPAMSSPASSVASPTAPAATACATPNSNGQYGCPEQCPLVLPADFQYPHLIEVNGVNGYFPAANATTKTDFTFDIPASYAGKTCTASFSLPEKSMLVTSDYTLTSPAGGEVSFSMGGKQVSSFSPMAGKSVVVSSGPCAAGQAVSYEMTASGGVDLRLFQDYNACAIGLFVVPS